jgi:hypothetical protein
METVILSYEELDRVRVVERVIEKRLTQREAARGWDGNVSSRSLGALTWIVPSPSASSCVGGVPPGSHPAGPHPRDLSATGR